MELGLTTENAFFTIGRLVYHFGNDRGRSRTRKSVVACIAVIHGGEESNLGWNWACPHRKRILDFGRLVYRSENDRAHVPESWLLNALK